MTEIVRGDGLKYVLAYNDFHNLESIGVNGKSEKLITYTYKNGNGRLKQMTYANGDTMKATYNSFGQMTGETWYNGNNVEMARYKYVYDGNGNINRSIDIHAKKEYNYEYEEGRIIRAAESDITLNGELVTGRTLVHTVRYYYNTEGQLTKKIITPAGGSSFIYDYTNTDDATTVQFTAGGNTVTSQSNTDHLGRKTFDELQLGVGTVSRQFSYHDGEVTEEHIANGKQKSSATTQLVSKIVLSDGRTLSYEYDAEERITKVIDSVEGTTVYTYDALGQLLTETKNGVVVNTMTYDNYGNIKTKNGVSYTYDATWKDLLTSYDGKSITYDAAGNVTSAPDSNFQYDTNNRLISFNGNAVSYDLDGNMLSNGSLTCTYDSANRLVSAGGHTYTYNAEDVRIRNLCEDEDTTYTYNTNAKLSMLLMKTAGGVVTKYVYGKGLIGEETNTAFKTYHFDCRGSTIAITNASGNITDTFAYDTYGKLLSRTGTSNVIFGYNGRDGVVTDANGLIYMRARYYSPEMKRFVNADIVAGAISNAITLNRFAYANGNPVSFVDPFGLSAERGEKNYSIGLKSIFQKFWGRIMEILMSSSDEGNRTRKNTITYDGNEYEIFAPNYSSDDDMEGWEQVDAISYEHDLGRSFNWANFVVGTIMGADDMDDIATGKNPNYSPFFSGIVAGVSLGLSALTAASNSVEYNSVHFTYTFQEKNGKRRVIITTGTSAQAELMNKYAGRSALATDSCQDMGQVAFVSHKLQSLYEEWTGDTPGFFTVCNFQVTVDKQHKNAKDFYYLWANDDGKLMMSPIVYDDDQVSIGKGYFWYRPIRYFPINGTMVASEDYQKIFEAALDQNGLAMQ